MTKENIMKKLKHVKEVVQSHGHNPVAVFLYGSQNYRLQNEESDVDTQVYIMPSLEDLIVGRRFVSKEYQTKYGTASVKDIRQLPRLVRKQNPTTSEILFTEYRIVDEELLPLFINRERVATYNLGEFIVAIVGTARNKYKEYKRKNDDPKAAAHIMRYDYMLSSLLNGEKFEDVLKIHDEKIYKEIKSMREGIIYSKEERNKRVEESMERLNSIRDNMDRSDYTPDLEAFEDFQNKVNDVVKNYMRKELENENEYKE